MTQEELDKILKDLLAKGAIECKVVDGKLKYYATKLGISIMDHIKSDPKDRN